ncbi:tRNA(fMet)-specific endonuclease VapC [Saccharothrix tamanrassetensis]|uniref:Ribonuclease VapC n=1 Tax=Saccharothrix tamanrassetensis TaxID=1051531 RepID=A0A841CJK2_9PSEU|nr:PIN domain-containing protein [Saccharothrix tamanrassetensis]MBB5956358.1 tRNA(fMet)-specific endonuclease VapC [Saccharothrix tamanrassetensis]
MARLILDTGVLVAGARGKLDLAAITDEDDVALPAILLAEYLTGVLLDDDRARRAVQRAFLDDVLSTVPIEDYTSAVAEHHAALLAHVKRTGSPRGAHDLVIAATARATNRTLVTTDSRARFDELPQVEVRLVEVRRR